MWAATGFWNGEPEMTTVLDVVGGRDSDVAEGVGAIAAAYKQAFGQEAVLVKQNACPVVALL
jgi:hypothetical protein